MATHQRLHKFLEANGTRIGIPDDRNFESEGEAIESGLRRTVESRDIVMRSLVQAVYRFRDATLVAGKKDDFGNALQNLYRELERAEDLVGPSGRLSLTLCIILSPSALVVPREVSDEPRTRSDIQRDFGAFLNWSFVQKETRARF